MEAGSGPLVVLLHGFPEFWYSWRYQIPALAAAGFRVVAPDMRGYNLSDKPTGVGAYRIGVLVRDIDRLIQTLGAESAVVAGHDWGGIVAWQLAMRRPARVGRLVVLNAPHPRAMVQALRTARQLRKSWYVFFYQLPWLPEAWLRARRFARVRRMLQTDPVRLEAFSSGDIERYLEAIARPGALTAAINYYRANLWRGAFEARRSTPIECPLLVIWGEHDRYLGAELAEPDRDDAPNARVAHLRDASHWVQVDRPDRVNALLLDFLR